MNSGAAQDELLMIQSMTGFGRASGALSPRYSIAVMAKSVNHRFLEATVRLPEYLWDVEPLIRAVGAEIFTRGKLDVSVRVQRTSQAEATVRINTHIAKTVVPRLRAIAEELGLGSTFSGGDLLRIPDLLDVDTQEGEITDEERDALVQIVRQAFEQLLTMRKKEGESLRTDIASRLGTIRQLQERLSQHRDEFRQETINGFRQRVQEIAGLVDADVREERIAQELVLLAERADIAEELTRLAHHIEQTEKAIGGNETAGKKLDFLSQEMLREINTMGSKSRSATLRTLVVELKTEVERIREQVQNVE
jgi:uncharacterized protein (TIGR00255 family)